MRANFLVLSAVLIGCAHNPPAPPDPHQVMHSHFFEPPSLAREFSPPAALVSAVPAAPSPHFEHLKGLRIALDPGHIGGRPWDERNGKSIYNGKGESLSEGLLALQLSMLLADQLTALGAVVYIDRGLAPVTAHAFDELSDSKHVFFQRLDLDARAERLWAFHPDLTLILHFDADKNNLDEPGERCNDTKAYVLGAFMREDLKDEVENAFVKIAWRHPEAWEESLRLSRAIVDQIHLKLGIPLAVKPTNDAQVLEPGVLARSLRLQRHLAGYVSSYVETLCYEDAMEFQELRRGDFTLTIDGRSYTYSPRLKQLATAIRDGVVHFSESR